MSNSADGMAYHSFTLGLYTNLYEAEGHWLGKTWRLEKLRVCPFVGCFWRHLIYQTRPYVILVSLCLLLLITAKQ